MEEFNNIFLGILEGLVREYLESKDTFAQNYIIPRLNLVVTNDTFFSKSNTRKISKQRAIV